jgi:hypothetical protein
LTGHCANDEGKKRHREDNFSELADLDKIHFFLNNPCSYNSCYYYLNHLQLQEQLNNATKLSYSEFPRRCTLSKYIDLCQDHGVSLKGYQIDFRDISSQKIYIALMNPQTDKAHYVVVEKMKEPEMWSVTDWPNIRYLINAVELQDLTQGYVLANTQQTRLAKSIPYLVTDTKEQYVGEHYKGEKVAAVINLKNHGEQELQIKKISVSCNCTMSEIENRCIYPDDSEDLFVQIDTHGAQTFWKAFVFIHTNEHSFPYQIITIKGKAMQLWSNEPETLLFEKNDLFDPAPVSQQLIINHFSNQLPVHCEQLVVEAFSDNKRFNDLNVKLVDIINKDGRFILTYTVTDMETQIRPEIRRGALVIREKNSLTFHHKINFLIKPPNGFYLRPQPVIVDAESPPDHSCSVTIGGDQSHWESLNAVYVDDLPIQYRIKQENSYGLQLDLYPLIPHLLQLKQPYFELIMENRNHIKSRIAIPFFFIN